MSEQVARLRADGICKSFASVVALAGADLQVNAAEIHALLGANGAGKSTLIKVICGVYGSDSGKLSLDGQEVRFSSASEAGAAGIAVVYQDPPLFTHLSVVENIFAGDHVLNRARLIDHGAEEKQARAAMKRLRINIDPHVPVSTLSVAEREYVAIVRALIRDSRVLILDEPTASLTPDEAARLFEVVRTYRDSGGAVLLVSHRLDEVRQMADRITIFRDGQTVVSGAIGDFSDDEIVAHILGKELAATISTELEQERPKPGLTLLEVQHLTKTRAFTDVSFRLQAGEIVALVGLVGSGRTELVETILGLRRETSGTVLVSGRPVLRRGPRQMARKGVVLVPEDRDNHGLVVGFSVSENIALTKGQRWHRGGFLDRRREDAGSEAQVSALSIRTSSVRADVASLSGGNRQKVVVGKWLARGPAVIILDEPTHGVDVGAKAELHAILRQLAHQRGIGVLVVSSDFGEILGLADRVLVMRSGRLTAELPGEDATESALLRAATAALPPAG